MANDTKHADTLETGTVATPRKEQSLARVQAVPWLIVILLIAACAWLGWRAFFHQEEGDPVASAAIFEAIGDHRRTTATEGSVIACIGP